MQVRWNLAADLEGAKQTQVFSGGACNILSSKGKLLRNTERDPINDWLTKKGVQIFDPQIHPDTHGVEYDYAVHHGMELAARAAAKVNLYEVSPRTFGGITSIEIAVDHFRYDEPMVLYFSDGDPFTDHVPAHSKKGYPLFAPSGLLEDEDATEAHYHEMIKNANNMRKYLLRFAQEMEMLTVTFNGEVRDEDVVITPNRMHAVDIFEAVVRAASGDRVYVNFRGGRETRDVKGNPLFVAPKNPPEVEMQMLLDQYLDEGNALRRAIAELVEISVFVRVVYTQRSVIDALREVLEITNILKD